LETTKYEKLLEKRDPHIRSTISTSRIMLDVVIALVPAFIGSIYFFGKRAIILVAAAVIACVLSEFLWQRIRKEPILVLDFSAVVTGVLLAFNVPVTTPVWVVVVASIFGIIVAKQFFGGLGSNFANPALIGRLAIMFFWPGTIANYVTTYHNGTDAITSATVLSAAKAGKALTEYSTWDMFIGNIPGAIGETSKLLLIIGFIYLCYRKVVNMTIAFSYLITVIAITFTFGGNNGLFTGDIVLNLLGGGLILGAFYMLTDYSFASSAGKCLMGVIAGVVTAGIRIWGIYPEGVCYGILVANCMLALIERFKPPHVYGLKTVKKK
jgi:electron transport complex protein RnfD